MLSSEIYANLPVLLVRMSMIRCHIIAGATVALICLPVGRVLANANDGGNSTAVDTTIVDSKPDLPETTAASVPSIPTRADSLAFQSVTRRVKPHSTARVMSLRDTVEIKGRDVSLQGVHRYAQPDSTLSWAEVKKVQRRGSAADRGAFVGAVVFGALGMIAAASSNDNGNSGGDVIAGTVGSAATGALLGAVVAAPFRRWKDVDLDSPNGGLFNDARRGFTLEIGVGPGVANVSNQFAESDEGTDLAGLTRFRLGFGFSERWAAALVADAAWSSELTEIDGLGVSLFSAPGTPSWTVDLTGGRVSSGDIDDNDWKEHFGIQAGLGLEFSRHWVARATLLHTSFGDENHTVIGTSIGKMWY